MASMISYKPAPRHALFDVTRSVSVLSTPQDTAKPLPHGKPPHKTSPQVSGLTPMQYPALTHENLRYLEALYHHEKIPAAPVYDNTNQFDHSTDDTESSVQRFHSTLPMQITPMERFEAMPPSNLPYYLYQRYHHFNSPYGGTTRPSAGASIQLAQSISSCLCELPSVHSEAGAYDYRLARDGQGDLTSPLTRIYGLHYGKASYTLTDIGAQFECVSSRDGKTK